MEIDHTEIMKIADHLRNSVIRIQNQVHDLGAARRVIKHDSDHREKMLSRFVKKHLTGKNKTLAEIEARNDPDFIKEWDEWADSVTAAYRIIDQSNADYAAFEANRSLLSASKNILDQLQG